MNDDGSSGDIISILWYQSNNKHIFQFSSYSFYILMTSMTQRYSIIQTPYLLGEEEILLLAPTNEPKASSTSKKRSKSSQQQQQKTREENKEIPQQPYQGSWTNKASKSVR